MYISQRSGVSNPRLDQHWCHLAEHASVRNVNVILNSHDSHIPFIFDSSCVVNFILVLNMIPEKGSNLLKGKNAIEWDIDNLRQRKLIFIIYSLPKIQYRTVVFVSMLLALTLDQLI